MDYLTTMKLSQCFRVLNVRPGDKWEVVRKSYYLLAKQYHPDLHPSNLAYENKLKQVTGAFKALETHYKIQEKNQDHRVRTIPRIRPGQSRVNGNYTRPEDELPKDTTTNPQDASLDAAVKKNRWNHWVQFFWSNLNKLERKIFLLDIRKNIQVHPHTAAHGGMIRMRKGKVTFQVKIPPGSWNRMSLRIPERGEASLFGKKRGDLLLNIQVVHSEPIDTGDTRFYYELHVPRKKINSSRVLTLDSVHGLIKFVLPRKTKDGQNFVLKSRPNEKSSSFSSHVVTIHLV